jgi:hypothetical protein
LDIDYYTKAKEYIESKVSPGFKYLYFSDDIEWVKSSMKIRDEDIIIDETMEDYMEFAVMQQCNHFIIANSSFSWWTAWLSKVDNKKLVIAPSNWFTEKFNYSWRDIYPEGWQVI